MVKSTPEDTRRETLVGTPNEVLQRAVRHYNAGELAAATTICHRVIVDNPQNAEAIYILANVALHTNEDEKSLGLFVRAVTIEPTNPKYSRAFAEALERSGRMGQALHAWTQFAELTPHSPDGPCRIAKLLMQKNRTSEAVHYMQRACALAPDDADIRYSLAVSLQHDGQSERAIEEFENAIQKRANGRGWAECHNGLSVSLRHCGRISDAIQSARRAIEIQPDFAMARNNLGLVLLDSGDTDGAVSELKTAHRLQPDDAEILNNLGVALTRSEAYDEAEDVFCRVLELRPGWSEGELNLANLLRQKNDLEAAVDHYRRALADRADDYRIYGNLALAQLNADRPNDAIASYEKALTLAPENPDLLKGLGIAQLLTGNYSDGWRHYEYRRQSLDFRRREFAGEPWDGASMDGGSLLVYSEQGFGDTLQFCRYLPYLHEKSRAGRIVFECQRPLCGLMDGLGGCDEVIARGDPLPVTDRHIGLLSLPLMFDTGETTIPGRTPYLSPPADRGKFAGIDTAAAPKIGLVWAGNPLRQDDAMRSCPSAALEPLLATFADNLFSLQVEIGRSDRALLKKHGVVDLSPEIDDFGDTAAAIAALDLIISVDTATAHLAGALNKPVWVLLGHAADWRYLRERDDSPWYPSMRLFRQERRGDWDGLIAKVVAALDTVFSRD